MEWILLYIVSVILIAVYTYGADCYVSLKEYPYYIYSKKVFRKECSFLRELIFGLFLGTCTIAFWIVHKSYKWTNPWGED